MVRPELWSSPTLSKVSRDAMLLFVGLWNYADDEGRAPSDPTLIRAALFPLREEVSDVDVEGWLRELAKVGVVKLYRARPRAKRGAGGLNLYQVTSWREHQKIDRPTESRWPPPRKHGAESARARRALVEESSRARRPREVKRREEEVEVKTHADYDVPLPGFDAPAASPNGEGVGRRSPWADKPNPWEDMEPIADDITRER